ncbi:MAG: rfbA [Glaciihabitans sp.]|nr:rfbA [Glaciihabitans sp.]
MPLLDEPLVSTLPPKGLFAGTAFSVRAVWRQRELLVLLVRRELKAKYKDSSLGFVWSLIRPITQLIIYYVAVGHFLGAAGAIPDYAVYIYTGLTVWTFFSEVVNTSTASIIANAGLVKKVYLPRELFPLAAIGSAIFNFITQFAVLLLAIIVFQGPPFVTGEVWLVPIAFVVLVLFSLALALFLSAANVFLRDIKHLVEVAILVLFWASPIVYSYTAVHSALGNGILEQLYLANPVTVVVLAFQKGLWYAGSVTNQLNGQTILPATYPPDMLPRLLITGVASLILVWIAQRIFSRLEGNFAQEI